MVHNGIEYGLMQLIAESYHLLKMAGGMTNKELHTVFSKWNEGILQSYLIEITADIFIQKDDLTPTLLIDRILDSAKQNGTGAWTSEDAMHLQVPIPVIDISVTMRDLSVYKKEREAAQQLMEAPEMKCHGDKNELVAQMEQALYFSIITAYAQGMALLQVASKEYSYGLNLEKIAAIWRGGCIIRASLLEDIRIVFSLQPGLSNLLLSNTFSKKLMQSQKGIRKIIQTAVETGIPLPAMMSALAYFDSYNSAWLPANLIQAQRDDFGAHTYERNDREGIFHTHWNQVK
jgi:6-phosphogluconate dehydrogenase